MRDEERLGSNTLRGFGPSYEATRWEFGIDAYTDLSLPLIAGSHVYTSTTDWSPYALMALRLSDGARVWCQDKPTGFPPEPVAAGHGLLIVIARPPGRSRSTSIRGRSTAGSSALRAGRPGVMGPSRSSTRHAATLGCAPG